MNPRKEYHAPMHTAEHILNQTMVRKFGIERSFSNHIERKKSKCDYHFDRDITIEEIADIEERINQVIEMNLPVTEEFIDINDARSKFNLIRLPKDAGDRIRIVRVGDYDACPCSGNHVKNTREIGKFKIISTSFNDNVLRARFKLLDKEDKKG
ncbi:Ser-tRNA(Ala) deacylase @ Gly-tRNA(Ala) deacylase [hydrothermal vent metagenome]|uniref:Ser-tRNA(Ala) deacylase @ Gly-tRNA(Ala) deacylase n=1 Tax=hydrothermal vent metagenome TaxID=652676 RepID=A0A3B1C921_9ZZZZ